MRLYNYLIIICLLFVYSKCNLPGENEFIEIDIEGEYDKLNINLKLSGFSDKVQYIALESSESSMIGGNIRIDITDNYIIARDGDNCFVFDKQHGHYIRKIGSKGRGPIEYESTRGFVNHLKEKVYFQRNHDLIEFDIGGQFLRSIKLPVDTLETNPSRYSFINDNFIGAYDNLFGDLGHRVIIFNNKAIIQVHRNRYLHPRTMPHFINLPQTHFYHSDDRLFLRDDYNDTVYLVTEHALSPYLVFNAGRYSLPYEAKWWPQEKIRESDLLVTRGFIMSETYVFFYIWGRSNNQVLLGIYNKKTRELQITDREKGIENDIDNFISFIPYQIYNNEMIGWVEAWKVEQWFKDNPEKAAQLPSHLKKFNKLSENDNPVLMLVKLKE
jgi:hypothetical protein